MALASFPSDHYVDIIREPTLKVVQIISSSLSGFQNFIFRIYPIQGAQINSCNQHMLNTLENCKIKVFSSSGINKGIYLLLTVLEIVPLENPIQSCYT